MTSASFRDAVLHLVLGVCLAIGLGNDLDIRPDAGASHDHATDN